MASCIDFWQDIGAPAWVLHTISRGLEINLSHDFVAAKLLFAANRKGARVESEFVNEEIGRLLESGSIREVPDPPEVVSPLQVVSSGEKKRLILDLSALNSFISTPRFRLEDVNSAWEFFSLNRYACKFDFRSGYHHISVSEHHKKFLGFSWRENEKERFFEYQVMPFGLSSAPYLFTKIFRVLVKKWRSQGFTIFLYLDDGLILANTFDECASVAAQIRLDLKLAGVSVAEEKCVWEPVHKIVWLGYDIDLLHQTVAVTERRLDKALMRIRELLDSESPTVLGRQRVLGTLQSMHCVLDGEPSIRSANLNRSVALCQVNGWSPKKKCLLSSGEIAELLFWRDNLRSFSWKSCAVAKIPQFSIETDASNRGIGGILRDRSARILDTFSKDFGLSWSHNSSTYREMIGIVYAIELWAPRVKNQSVIIRTDSQNAVSILKKGSSIEELSSLALKAANILRDAKIDRQVAWSPRSLNEEADALSRVVDRDDWGISNAFFEVCQRRWGLFQTDCFASVENSKCEYFYSLSCEPESRGADVFAHFQVVANAGLAWWVPPPHLIPKLIAAARLHRAVGVLGCPLWPSHYFFSLLRSSDGRWRHFVKDSLEFPVGSKMIVPGPGSIDSGAFSSPFLHFPFLFLYIDFTTCP